MVFPLIFNLANGCMTILGVPQKLGNVIHSDLVIFCDISSTCVLLIF